MNALPRSSYVFSQRAQQSTSSAIREILKITMQPEIISFAGGLPAPQGFPVEVLNQAFNTVLQTQSEAALQYGPTEGYQPLRQWIADELSTEAAKVSVDEILVVSGSQQALDLLGKLFLDEGSKVLIETPSYLGAIQSFSQFGPVYQGVPSDDSGLNPDGLDDETVHNARFIYVLPNFQNPTGSTLSLERRQALVKRCAQVGLPIIEDDPYGELRYAGQPLPSLLNLGRQAGAAVIRMGSFSKVLAPGLRLGYVAAPAPIIAKLAQLKQATDLHTATLTQMAVYEAVKTGFLATHLPKVRELYREKCQQMLQAMAVSFPSSVKWNVPEGGMFIWVSLPDHINAAHLLQQAIANKVAFVPGSPFYAGGVQQHNTLRLSFVTVSEARIREGIAILGKLIHEYIPQEAVLA